MGMPQVESHADNDQIVVRVTLPGLDPDADVRIGVIDHTLAIDVVHVGVASREQASHRVNLPASVSERDLDVTFEGDVLQVRVPLHER
jgi:HSP20 family molecular chaperone IbpA